MNRGEQVTLFRESHNIRLQQEAKAHHQQQLDRQRHYSYGNIHQVSNLQAQSINSRSHGEDRPFGVTHCDDLVLSVLKSPIKKNVPIVSSSSTTTSTTTINPQSHTVCAYTALQGSEDELVDDVESAKDTMDFDGNQMSPRAFKFLRRFRPGRPPKFEPHHRRVPTPMRRKTRKRSGSRDEIFDQIKTNGKLSVFTNFLSFSAIVCHLN